MSGSQQSCKSGALSECCQRRGVALFYAYIMEPVFLTEPYAAMHCPAHYSDSQQKKLADMMVEQFFKKTEVA